MCSWQVMPITKARLKNEPCDVKESIAVVLEVVGLNLFNKPRSIRAKSGYIVRIQESSSLLLQAERIDPFVVFAALGQHGVNG
jgi:hypothetical protein